MTNIASKLSIELHDKLRSDKRTRDERIEVVDNNGVITLAGTVASNHTRAVATLIVFSHPRVLCVINEIVVDDPEETVEIVAILPLPAEMTYQN